MFLFAPPHFIQLGKGKDRMFHCAILEGLLGPEFYAKDSLNLKQADAMATDQIAQIKERQ